MRKRALTLRLLTIMAVSMTACSSKKNITSKTTEKSTKVSKETTEDKLKKLKGRPLADTIKEIKKLGYKGTYFADGVDFTDFIDDMKDDYTTGTIEINKDKKIIKVTLVLTSNLDDKKSEDALRKKLEAGSAWISVKKYGESKYGTKFKLHYLKDKLAENVDSKDTWFLKAGCTIDGIDKTCEAKVTGTTDDPKVTSFDVY
ncbi:MAG: hypothetical protein PHD56_12630 [Anaerostipes sp.]|nr:hypothetical protein [Anaerostipes sp.]